jgi:hypothetical protein
MLIGKGFAGCIELLPGFKRPGIQDRQPVISFLSTIARASHTMGLIIPFFPSATPLGGPFQAFAVHGQLDVDMQYFSLGLMGRRAQIEF